MTNFALGLLVARSLGIVAFGIFSLAWVTYALALNLSRGLATDPLVVRFSGATPVEWRAAVSKASGTALLIGAVAGGLTLLVGLTVGGVAGPAFIALGLALPVLLLQDSWRYAFFATGQGHKAFLNDGLWAIALVPALFLANRYDTVFAFVLAWGCAASAAALYGAVQSGVLPRPTGTRDWLRSQRDLGSRYVVENLCLGGAAQLRMYGVGAIAGSVAVGAIRGVELLLGPFLSILMGLSMAAVPEGARMLRRSARELARFCVLLGLGQAIAALTWGLMLLFLVSDAAGRFVLASVWQPASALILPATLAVSAAGLCTGAGAGLRALGASRRSLRAQLVVAMAYLGAGVLGAAWNGALGSAWGIAAAMTFGSVVWWTQFRAGLRDHVTSLPSDHLLPLAEGQPTEPSNR